PVQILLGLIASDLILQLIDLLLTLQVVYLLLLARRIRFSLDTIDLLVGLQALKLLVVAQLVQLPLGLVGLGFFRLRWFGFLLLDLVEGPLRPARVLITFYIFQLLLALQCLYFFLLARLG